MGITKKISLTIIEAIKLLIRRSPLIALYSVCIALIWMVGTYAYTEVDKSMVRSDPASKYIKYTSLTTNNIREGEDLTYTVCRDFVGRYDVQGLRTIYVIPSGKSPKDRVFEVALPYKGPIEGKPCQAYKVAASTYRLEPGSYQLSLSGTFKVNYGIEKSYYIDGDVLTVYPQPSGVPDLRTQIFNLTPEEITELRRVLGLDSQATAADRVSTTPTVAAPASSSMPSPVVVPSPSSSPSTAPATASRPCVIGLLALCILGTR